MKNITQREISFLDGKIGVIRIYKENEEIEEEFRDIETLQSLRVKYNWGPTGNQFCDFNTPYDDILKMVVFINRKEMEKNTRDCLYCAIQGEIFDLITLSSDETYIMKYIYIKGIYFKYNESYERLTCEIKN